MKTHQLILDFDGVLIDSYAEIVVTAWNTGCKLNARSLAEIPQEFQDWFLLNRYLLPSPPEMVKIVEAWKSGCWPQSVRLQRHDVAELFTFLPGERRGLADRFFATRACFMESDLESWLSLNIPFDPLWSALAERPDIEFLVLTNKNGNAVRELARKFRLPLTDERIYAGERARPKRDNYAEIIQRFPAKRNIFVDDAIENLLDLGSIEDVSARPELIYAAWGYGSEADQLHARSLGIRIAGQPELITLLQEC